MVIAGDRDMLIPACYGRRMADAIPGSEFVLIPDCGHNPFIEKPDVIVPRITEFLMRPSTETNRRRHEETRIAMEETA